MWILKDASNVINLKFSILQGYLVGEFEQNNERNIKPDLLDLISKRDVITTDDVIEYFDSSIAIERDEAIGKLKEIVEALEKDKK